MSLSQKVSLFKGTHVAPRYTTALKTQEGVSAHQHVGQCRGILVEMCYIY